MLAQRLKVLPQHFFSQQAELTAALKARGVDVINLDIGSPDLPPPDHILAALHRSAAQPDHHGYLLQPKTRPYRQAWAAMYRRLYGVELNSETEIISLMGSKEGIFNISLALLDPGDLVLAGDPGYITYYRGAQIAGAQVYPLPLTPGNGFLPDLAAIPAEIASRARLLWLNYPNNPTAAVASLDFFRHAVEFAQKHNLLVCHDAAYAQVTFDGYQAPSLMQIPGAGDVAVEFNTLSKSHNMAGWRVGAAVGNPTALKAIQALKNNIDSGHFLPILDAAVEAMTTDQSWLAGRNQIYQARRDVVLGALQRLGLAAPTPKGSLYVWSPVPSGWTSAEFCRAALERAGVALTPGTLFGENGEGWFRLSFTAPLERLQLAGQRLQEWLLP